MNMKVTQIITALILAALSCWTARAPSQASATWEELGPTTLGGRVSAIAVDPRDLQHIFAGTPAGGLWGSTDGGQSWSMIAPWLSSIPISALAIDPVDSRILLAGTGAMTDGGILSAGMGLLRSTDGGKAWIPLGTGLRGPYIASILIWPNDPKRVLIATDLGMGLSTDGGVTTLMSLRGDAIAALVRDPFEPLGVYALGRNGAYYSRDRGTTWSRRSSWPLGPTDTYGVGVTSLAVSSRTPGLLFAAVQILRDLNQTDRGLLLQSNDGGYTFTPLGTPTFCPESASCGFAQAVAIDPEDDQNLLLGGDRLYVSHDQGIRWDSFDVPPAKVHSLIMTARGCLVAAATGIALLDPMWRTVIAQNSGLAITSIVSLDVAENGSGEILAGTADTGTVFGSGDSPVQWQAIFHASEPGGTVRFDPLDSSTLFVSQLGGRFFRSSDRGRSFTAVIDGLDFMQAAIEPAPLEPSALIRGELFTGRLQLFKSANSGSSWAAYRPQGFPAIARIALSRFDADRVYFSLDSGAEIYKADDIGTEILSVSQDREARITSIYPDPSAQNILYATLTNSSSQRGYIMKSWDFGQQWTDITPPELPAASAVVKDRYGALYVGTADGVRRSPNDGANWSTFGLLGLGVSALRMTDQFLYAGTTGRGIFRIPVRELTVVDAIPPGFKLQVDGVVIETPFYASWEPGSVHTVAPYLEQTADSRQAFVSWSDGLATDHQVVAPTGNSYYYAAIEQSYRLRLNTAPESAGVLYAMPASADGFYPLSSFVHVVADPAPNYRFTGFTGNLNGNMDVLGFVLMDRPRAVTATFEPLRLVVRTEPPGLRLTIDGQSITTPATFAWDAGSVHRLAAPETIPAGAAGPVRLAFSGWSDLLEREHDFTMSRDTFVTDLVAEFIPSVPDVSVPPWGLGRVVSAGVTDGPHIAGLELTTDGDVMLPGSLQLVRGTTAGDLVTQLVLAPSSPQVQTDLFVEEAPARATRLTVFNPGSAEADVSVHLRDSTGSPLLVLADAFKVPPGASAVRRLAGLAPLPPKFEGLLTLHSAQPIVVSVQSVRQNLRPSTFFDSILLATFLPADQGVSRDARVQAVVCTPYTQYALALSNPGLQTLSGTVLFRDEQGTPAAFFPDDQGQLRSSLNYSIPGGGYRLVRTPLGVFPSGRSVSGALEPRSVLKTARAELLPAAGQQAPLVQLWAERTVPVTRLRRIVLPYTLPPSASVTVFAVPLDLTAGESGVVLTNPGLNAARLTFTLLSPQGISSEQAVLDVPANQQAVAMARTLFPSLDARFVGALRAVSSIPVEAVGVLRAINRRREEILAGFPVLTMVTVPATHYSMAIDGDSWSSRWWFLSMSAVPSRVRFSFRGDLAQQVFLPIQ